MKIQSLFVLASLVGWLQSCNMINPKESIPTYLKIDSVQMVSTNTTLHGSVSHKITDVWVYYNRQLLGAYQLPAKVPILSSEKGEVEIVAGIWDNGLSGTRAKYPFYTLDIFNLDPKPGEIVSHTPKFSYHGDDSTKTSFFIEDFEQGNSFERYDGDTTFVKTDSAKYVFEGIWSNKLELKDTISHGSCITVQNFTLPSDKICYLELNYKSDIPFVLRVKVSKNGSSSIYDLTGINPTTKWNKIYINFGSYVAAYQNAQFRFILDAVLPSGTTQGNVLIDNFKVIHFE